jgi:hypothetical protein
MSMWDRVRRYAGPIIDQNHRVCGVCDRRFLSGVIKVQRGYTIGAICHTCAASGAKRVLNFDDLRI